MISQFDSFAADRDRLDSIGVQKIGDRTFILHQVVGQETLFSISRRYKVPMVAIQEANEALKQGIKDGQTLLVPFGQPSNSHPVVASTSATPAPVPTTATTQAETRSTAVNSGSSTNKVESPVVVSQPVTSTKTTAPEPKAVPSSTATTETKLELKTTHKIVRGESLFSIADKYNVTIAELKKWNSLTSNKVLVGQSLKILASVPVEEGKTNTEPLAQAAAPKEVKKEEVKKEEPKAVERKVEQPKEAKETIATSTSSSSSGEWTSHTVKSGESLFSLSKLYGTSIEDLIQWNALTSNNLKVGQSIKVGKGASATVEPVVKEVRRQQAAASAQSVESSATPKQEVTAPKEEVTAPNTSGGFTNTKETGLAELIPGTEANKKYLVLHRTAPVGSVIRVKNEENNLTIFARVVGVLPETGDNSKVLIKLSQAAFEQLKGVNSRFPVEILY
ncbi:MAG: LysM peptidoglycan-binding domain-containing protein [Algoriphagus sp.]|nr:LysM peptidoglycan-binding domain-containing protein [Algoriphagus sp.]